MVEEKEKMKPAHPKYLKPSAVEKMGLQDEVFRLRKEGAGLRKISEIIKAEHGKDVSYFMLKSFLENNSDRMTKYLSDDPEGRAVALNALKDITSQFTRLNEEAWEYFNLIKSQGKLDIRHLKAMETLLKIIKENYVIVRSIASPETAGAKSVTVNKTNVLNVSQNIDKTISYFEEQGMVLVNKRDYEDLKEQCKQLKKKLDLLEVK